jgi:hypothetical protein
MLKSMIVFAILIAACGCSAVVSPAEVAQLNSICAKNGGLAFAITTGKTNGYNEFYCADGAKFSRPQLD